MSNAKLKPKATPTLVPKQRKAKIPTLPLAVRFEIMNLVKTADRTTPDATLTAMATAIAGRPVPQQTISAYRKQFGIPSVRKPGVKSLQARITMLEALIVREGFEVPA